VKQVTVATLVVALLSDLGLARAAEVDEALSLESQGRLAEALASFEEALNQGGRSRDELLTIYQHLGVLRYSAGDREGSRQALWSLRALTRHPSLPALAPPEVHDLLAAVSDEWGDRVLQVAVSVEARADGAEIEARAVHDLADMVAGAELRAGNQRIERGRGNGPYQLIVDSETLAEEGSSLSICLVDENDAVLVEAFIAGGFAAADGEGSREEPRGQRSRAAWIAGWTLVASGIASVTTGAVLAGIDGQSTGGTRTQDGTTQQQLYQTARAGWVLVGTGAAVLVAGVVLLIVRPRAPERAAAIRAAGAGVVARW
jgi:hypothetical protein